MKNASASLLKINDKVGLHPSLKPLTGLLEQGQLAIVPGVSYPNPNRSHFESMAIWHTTKFDPAEQSSYGWLGRCLDACSGQSVLIGSGSPPVVLRGRRAPAISLARPEDLLLRDVKAARDALGPETSDELLAFVRRQSVEGIVAGETMARLARNDSAYFPAGAKDDVVYPATGLAHRLRLASRMFKKNLGARVVYTLQSGYDTHAAQSYTHANLLNEFAGAVGAFFADLTAAKLADRVMLLAFSEFGRAIKENGSGGTDHGTAGCVFLAGPMVKGGLAGMMPSLTDLEQGEPKMTTDFRRIYATLLDRWLSCPSEQILGGKFEHLPVL